MKSALQNVYMINTKLAIDQESDCKKGVFHLICIMSEIW